MRFISHQRRQPPSVDVAIAWRRRGPRYACGGVLYGQAASRQAVRAVVAGFDGTSLGAAAVAEAARSVGPKGMVFVVCASQTPRNVFGRPQAGCRMDDVRSARRQMLDDLWSKHDALPRARFIPELVCGRPADALAGAAAICRAEAIFVGARPAGRLRGMGGTVAQELQRVATVPVIAVTQPRGTSSNGGFGAAGNSEPEIPNLVRWW